MVTCETVQDEKCEDVTQGYTTEQKCTKWPREVCTQETKTVLKYSPETDCRKVPRDLCGPSGCVLQPGPEECFDKKETIISEVHIKDIHTLESVQDFLIKLDIKPPMHLLEISTFSLNNVIVRLTKIMNRADKNWAHF